MRIRRGPAPGARDESIVTDAEGQAAWDDDAAPRSGRRRRLFGAAALGLAALVLLGVFVVSRSRPPGDILALGTASDPSGLPPVDDFGLLTDEGGSAGQSQVTPGDSIPGVPAGGDPGAVAAGDAAPGGATPAGGTPGAVAGAGTPAGGGAATGIPGGPGPRDGIPIPTTRPGGSPATGGTGTPPPPQCAIFDVTVDPPQLSRHRSEKLYGDPKVTFRQTNCGPGEFRVRANGLDVPSTATGDGSYTATIPGNAAKWTADDHRIEVIHIPTGVKGFGELMVT